MCDAQRIADLERQRDEIRVHSELLRNALRELLDSTPSGVVAARDRKVAEAIIAHAGMRINDGQFYGYELDKCHRKIDEILAESSQADPRPRSVAERNELKKTGWLECTNCLTTLIVQAQAADEETVAGLKSALETMATERFGG